MGLAENLMAVLPDGKVLDVRIGLHWTAVIVDVEGKRQCGLASTVTEDHQHGHIRRQICPRSRASGRHKNDGLHLRRGCGWGH